ncbi:MAG TPA: hypothetical protein ENK91_13415, partial [Bacteroidetes bacterium]|nr:hypothetical protein [Bacteroidota bacterium]
MKRLKPLFLLLFSVLIFLPFSCKKDSLLGEKETKAKESILANDEAMMGIDDAKELYWKNIVSLNEKSGFTTLSECDRASENFRPLWIYAQELTTSEGIKLVTVPLGLNDEDVIDGVGAQLVFYADSDCETPFELVVYETSNSDPSRTAPIDNSKFTGTIASYNFCDCTANVFGLENGLILERYEIEGNDFLTNILSDDSVSSRNDEEIPCADPDCPSFKPKGKFKKWLKHLINTIKGLFTGGSGDGPKVFWVGGVNWKSHFPYSGENTSGGGDGGPVNIATIFDGNFFNGEGQNVSNQLEIFIAENNLEVCTEDLFTELYQCFSSTHSPSNIPHGGASSSSNELSVDDFLRILRTSHNDPCILDVIVKYQNSSVDMETGDGAILCFIGKNNHFDVSDENLFEKIKEHCQNDEACQNDVFDCLSELDQYQTENDVTINEEMINQIVFESNICGNANFTESVDLVLLDIIYERTNTTDSKDREFLKNSPHMWSYILNPDNDVDGGIFELIMAYLRKAYNDRNSPYNQTNQCENDLMDSHPMAAAQLGFNWVSANTITRYMMGDNGVNDCSDAFRHSFFNALNSAFLGTNLARSFGEAHECETSSQMAKTMDLHNNEVGYAVIENNPDLRNHLIHTDAPGWTMS